MSYLLSSARLEAGGLRSDPQGSGDGPPALQDAQETKNGDPHRLHRYSPPPAGYTGITQGQSCIHLKRQ